MLSIYNEQAIIHIVNFPILLIKAVNGQGRPCYSVHLYEDPHTYPQVDRAVFLPQRVVSVCTLQDIV